MEWWFVKRGKDKVRITFVATKDGKPVEKFGDMNMAYHYEEGRDFKNPISEFNKKSSEIIAAGFEGKDVYDDRDIIDIHEFKRRCKDVEVKFQL